MASSNAISSNCTGADVTAAASAVSSSSEDSKSEASCRIGMDESRTMPSDVVIICCVGYGEVGDGEAFVGEVAREGRDCERDRDEVEDDDCKLPLRRRDG